MNPRTTHNGPPGGFLIATEAAARLGHSRQAFYATGLADWLESWIVGRVRLYRSGDVDQLASLIAARPGLRALGLIDGNAPLIPSDELWHWWLSGDLQCQCPNCGDWDALKTDEGAWCPNCGLF